MSIALVTDSTADLPAEILAEHPIEVVPAMLIIEGRSYADGEGISRDQFYANLPQYKEPPTTSAPSVGVFQEAYERLIQRGATQILSIHLPASLSGLIDIASLAAQAFNDRVKVIDSGQVTLAMGFQVLAAAEAIKHGCSLDEALAAIAAVRKKVRFMALLDTLEYIRRSGRVSWATAAVSNFLNLKVMIEVRAGQVFRLGLFHNRQQGIAKLTKQILDLGPLERFGLVYTDLSNRSEIQSILNAVTPAVATPPIVLSVTTVIGTHVGSNGIGFIAVPA